VLGVQLRDPLSVDVFDRQMTILHASRGGRQNA
jgi:hypothetical protein